jgi:cytochrome c peroxidase
MSDTLTVIQVNGFSTIATVSLSPGPIERTAEQRGEAAFHDGRSALDRWMSCASCHAGGHTSGLSFDTNGDGGYGAAKDIPTLLGCGPTAPYSWIGRFATLEAQIAESLDTSLRGPGPQPDQVADLAAFLRSLEPAPARRSSDDPAALRGKDVFQLRGCDACHVPPTYTSPVRRDVGLTDGPDGNRRFNPPSLRGVSRSAPYLHDGRAETLNDVLQIHHPGTEDTPWDQNEADDLAAFLESL